MIRWLFIPLLVASLPLSALAEDGPFATAAARIAAGDWPGAAAAAAEISPSAQSLVEWTRLRAGEGAFTDYVDFLAAHPHWPGLERLRTRGEAAIPPRHVDPAAVVAYFADRPPLTADGVLRLAEALTTLSRAPEAEAAVIEAWLTLPLDAEGEIEILEIWGELLTEVHPRRAETLLWRGQTEAAARLLPLLSGEALLLAQARLAEAGRGDRATALAALPANLRDDPGLAHDRFVRLADEGDYADAVALLLARSGDAASLGQPVQWASRRAILVRWAMREGRPDEAYELATSHFITAEDGESFVDLEWLAGYLALRYRDDPALALTHFARVEAAAKGPITTTRAAYWTGRALEAQGDPAAAEAYGRAAEFHTAFYGLLAAEKLGLELDPRLAGGGATADWRNGNLLGRDLTQAMLYLLSAGDLNNAALFASRYGQDLDRETLEQLGGLFAALDEPFLAVIAGKQAAERGIVVPELYLPLHRLAALPDLPVAPELALAIARRESEFNTTVQSPVGARGIMQVMPDTGEEVAADLGLPYDLFRLETDWEYNTRLGTAYLAELIAEFGESPVLVAAGYNAGPGRPLTWMALRGDPRRGEVDVIDWIEHIPFAETRAYVMRVSESIPAYRARLTGETEPIAFTALLTGVPPFIRPQSRPDRSIPTPPETGTEATMAPVPPLRPVARPAG
jgi:soluble lytic murein transglycosylase